MSVFSDYLDKVIGKHGHIDRTWLESKVADQLGEDDYQRLMKCRKTSTALKFGIMIGVRQNVKGTGDIVKVYHNKEEVASREFIRPVPEEE